MTISRRLLLQVGLGSAFVVAVVTAVTHRLVYQALTRRDMQHLMTYVQERAQREEARFAQVQANLRLLRSQFLQRLNQPPAPETESKWTHYFRKYDDGAWRSREEFKDATKYSSMWAHRDWSDSASARRRAVIAQELCDEMLPGWIDEFPSYYFQFPGPLNIGVDMLMPLWAWEMPADYKTEGVEWLDAALPRTPPPPERFAWTGLQKDRATAEILVCVYLPIYQDGVFLGSAGHNMSIQGTLDRATHPSIPGAAHYIYRSDGRIIFAPGEVHRIESPDGGFAIQSAAASALADSIQFSPHAHANSWEGYSEKADMHYVAVRLNGPDWIYVTTMRRDYLQSQALASARWVLWSCLCSIGLVVTVTAVLLRRQLARPLAELNHATEALAAGDASASVPSSRADELGTLARSFARMVDKVTLRETELRQLNASLETRIAERTLDLNRALERERELGELKSRFVSMVSHEFRTPLGIIMSSAEILDTYLDRLSPEERRTNLEDIFRSSRHMAGLMEQVLLLGRVEAGKVAFRPVEIDLPALCCKLADEVMSATSGRSRIEFTHRLQSPIGMADENVLRHIFTNLLNNAVKYSPAGSTVEFTLERAGASAKFAVRDRGVGIPEADQRHLYEAFHRGVNVGNIAGTGLGLVIVKNCVELHGGSIQCDSRENIGTCFTVLLPLFGDTSSSKPASLSPATALRPANPQPLAN